MSASIDETDRVVTTSTTTIDSALTNKTNNNNVINHPLSNINGNDSLDEMTEINLKLDNDNNINVATTTTESTTTKSNWVKFDDDDGNSDNNGNQTNLKMETTITTEAPVVSNSKSNNNKNSLGTSATTPIKAKLPPPSSKKTTLSNAPVSSTIQNSKTLPSSSNTGAAVLTTESVHVNIDKPNSPTNSNINNHPSNSANQTTHNNAPKNISISMPTPTLRTIELSTGRIREGFVNGDVIVTLLPTNTKWPWITPAVFRPELVPEELMAQGLTLTVEEYVNAMETLVNDYRFTVYNICYKRVLVCWIVFAFCVLLTLLFSGLQGIALFSLGVAWLFLNAAAIFLCMWIKLRLSRGLEKCLARVNKQFLRHKILLVLDDRGRISCHKVNLCFMYFDPALCIAYLNDFIERQEQNGNSIQAGWEKKLDLEVNDIVIQGSNPVRLSRKQAVAQEIFLSYLQRWGKDFLRRRLDWTCNEAGVHEQPRHLMSSICPCQYEEEILHNKIKLQQDKSRCCGLHNPFKHL